MRIALACLWLAGLLSGLQAADYTYTLSWLAPHLHTYVIELEVSAIGTETTFGMPIWRPGRYRDQFFAAGVNQFEAFNRKGNKLKWEQIDPSRWAVTHKDGEKVRIRYQVRAEQIDAGSSNIGPREIYFNPVNLFMYVNQDYDASVSLRMPDLDKTWDVASALDYDAASQTFTAGSYHEFVDCPTVCAPDIHQLSFQDQGVTFKLYFQGDYKGNKKTDAAILEAVQKICAEQRAIFGAYPFEDYHLIYRLLPNRFRHAVEHSNSVSFAVPADVTSTPQKIVGGLASLTAHEVFHAWNVKRIRPARLWPYDYSQPQHSSLHWFTEGVTDYYSFLTLVRAGIWTEEQFLNRLGANLTRVENDYAAWVRPPARVSMDSWQDQSTYRPSEWNVSYYTLGMRLGLLIDLRLRAQSKGRLGLDDVLRYLLVNYYEKGQGVPEDGVQLALEKISGTNWADFFAKYVHGVEPFDYARLFKSFDIGLEKNANPVLGLRRIGVLQSEVMDQGVLLRNLHPGGDARKAGLSEGELILQVDGQKANLLDLDDFFAEMKTGGKVKIQALTFGGLRTLELVKTGAFSPQSLQLTPISSDNALRVDWLRSQIK